MAKDTKQRQAAKEFVKNWLDKGYDVSVITGRPYSAMEPSREWLNRHNLVRVPIYFLNKYGDRWYAQQQSPCCLELEDYYKMPFDYAVEDSPRAFRFFSHLPNLKVLVFDRPWNRETPFPTPNYRRVPTWPEIQTLVK